MPERTLCQITSRVLYGLATLHKSQHVVHRDIKPANILLNMDGEAKITVSEGRVAASFACRICGAAQ